MKKTKKSEIFLMIFIMIQPLLDCYQLYTDEIRSIFGFSPTTIIRAVFVGIFMIYVLFKTKYNKKYFWFVGYFVLLLGYLIGHFHNALAFDNSIGGQLWFNWWTEIYYLARMSIPLLMIYITYQSDIKTDTFRKAIIVASLIFAFEIIITNILKVSLTSYGGNKIIKDNIFAWFSDNKYWFKDLASKGFFNMANQISGILCMLFAINLYFAIKYSKLINLVTSTSLALAMIMIGTRVGTYGWILLTGALFIGWIFFAIIHKNKIGINFKKLAIYIIVSGLLIGLTMHSPLVAKRRTFKQQVEKAERAEKNNSTVTKKEVSIDDKIQAYHKKYSIPLTYFKELYPYVNDEEFWEKTIKLPYSVRGGNRNLQNIITRRIYERNDNKYDKLWGMGYSRFRNAKLYIEQDFVVHFFTLGIFGILLFLMPYFAIATYALLWMFKNKALRMRTSVLCGTIYLTLLLSYNSGHLMDELLVTIILGFISGFTLLDIKRSKEKLLFTRGSSKLCDIKYDKQKPFISVIVPIYNAEKYLKECLDSLVNQTLKNIEIILIDDGAKDKSGDIADEYAQKYSNVIVKHVKNGGVSKARNHGLALAKGEYITFIDSDDHLDLTTYEKMYYKAISNNLDIVGCNTNIVYPKKTVYCNSNIPLLSVANEKDKKFTLINSYAVIWNKIYNKNLLKNITFKEGSNFCEDVEFLYHVIPKANSFGNVNEYLYYYIQHEGSLTYVYDEKLYQLIDNFDGLLKLYKKEKPYKNYKDEIEYSYIRYLYGTFIKRLAKTKDKEKFADGVELVIKKVTKNYPKYKKNKYIKKLRLKNIYYKLFNKKIAKLIFIIEKNRKN